MEFAITVRDLHVSYFGNEVVRDVSFEVEVGSMVGIIGPNGAGKSTLIKALLDLIPRDKGNVRIFGKETNEFRKKIAYVPQRSMIDWTFPITVMDTVLIGTYPSVGLFKFPKKKEKVWALECLRRVGLEDFRDRQIGELSGGQQQRVFLARALAQKPELLLLDEPFVGIDVASEDTIIRILKELQFQDKTIVVVHHDLSKAYAYFDQLLLMNKELIKFGTVDEVLNREVMSRAYSYQLPFLEKTEVLA
ncbi:metal ABC transporter ATP-binding protein [Brevibacillus sp. HB1.2]|uniref:metal ABC transporter ATP-binding protein n=1 Tax=Brevibacillus TaxID=55080 RepID=UPI00037C2740|nr:MULTISPECIES: metal ABC transporter ATP-binding protein [unclassified Brevibacillus]ATF12037.1 manganese transporter [Brevibacillus brevis X23]MDC0762828.1 metal ABC transporter ATP-binding protein [Brevibacillus sp. AG]NRS20113.1 metal ABC transporter ATP-binding protein [Brevibacillus sp. HB1.4B]NTU20323.1 metal ABC transporter ATP-binding protein [Brevibacillus sp. HB1.2]NTU32148.1 metal ABC transporter ATP-binding protein [Brevibacillus sp. HB1.1]